MNSMDQHEPEQRGLTTTWRERQLTRRGVLRFAVGAALALPTLSLLAACGGDDDDDSTPVTSAATATTGGSGAGATSAPVEPTAAATAPAVTTDPAASPEATMAATAPVMATPPPATTPTTAAPAGDQTIGGTLRVALSGEPPALDQHGSTDAMVIMVVSHMYETLFTWDADYSPVPLLASGVEISDDGLTVTVALREDVPFHNGDLMTASDVIASIERWGTLSGLGEGLLEVTDSITEVDPATIEFALSVPFGTFMVALARGLEGCAIHPKAVIEASTEDELAEPIGTGPYQLVEWTPDKHILLERFADYASPEGEVDGYAGAKGQYLDEIEFIPVRDEAARVAGLQAGDYHYLETVSPDQYSTLQNNTGVVVEILPADSWLNIVLNLLSPVLEDQRIRRALQMALDHEAIMLAAFGKGFYELTPELVPGAPIWYSDAGREFFNVNDPEGAKALLTEAGYDGAPLRIMVSNEIQQEYNGTLTMAQQLEAVGFTVDLQVLDSAALSDRRRDDAAWETYTAWASFRPDPAMRNLTCSASGSWCTPDKDQLLARLQQESDYETRFEIWEQVQERFYDEVPRVKIGNSMRLLAHAQGVMDIGPTALQPDFSNTWLDE